MQHWAVTVVGEVMLGSVVSQARGIFSQCLARNPGQRFIFLLPGASLPKVEGRVSQMAAMAIVELIFEADLPQSNTPVGTTGVH